MMRASQGEEASTMSMKQKNLPWCCSGFRAHYEEGGSRGTSIVVVADETGEPRFLLQHRTVDLADQASMPKISVPINLVSQTGLRFCPWCGQRLARFYRRSWSRLVRPDIEVM